VVEYQLIRSTRRKSLSLQVKQGQVLVRAPLFLPVKEIELFLVKKSQWLEQKLTAQKHHLIEQLPRFTQGSKLFYLGKLYQLVIQFADKSAVQLGEQQLIVVLSNRQQKNIHNGTQLAKRVKLALGQFFKHQLNDYLVVKLPIFTTQCQLSPSRYKVRFYKARWGSCNNKSELSFNYLLMMLPTWVIDYIIVHELCHLQHLNHSRQFWQLVLRYQPDYKQAVLWLKKNQHQLRWS
jgi:predicted metal-dependent hydrolase